MQRKTLLIIIGLVFFIIIPVIMITVYASQSLLFTEHGYISLISIPQPIHVTTRGRSANLNANQKYPVNTGYNTIVFSASGFQSSTVHVTIKKNQTTVIPIQLTPVTSLAKSEVNSPKYQKVLQQISDKLMNNQVKSLESNNPILSQLPISTFDYTITPCNQQGDTIAICINSFIPGTTYMQQEGVTKLQSLGYDLSKYKIYVDGNLEQIN